MPKNAAKKDELHVLVDELSDAQASTAHVLLRLLRSAVPAEELEDALNSYELRRLRAEQAGDEGEPLESFGKRNRLE